MTQIMLEVGSNSLAPVQSAIESALADLGYTIEVLQTEDTSGLKYRLADADLDAVCARLATGELSSVRLRSDGADVAWALLFGPTFGSDCPRPWTGALELRHTQYRPLFEQLVKGKDLDFVVVSQEETLDLTPAAITSTTFPWNDWRLIMAALPSGSAQNQEWVIRAGPAGGRK